ALHDRPIRRTHVRGRPFFCTYIQRFPAHAGGRHRPHDANREGNDAFRRAGFFVRRHKQYPREGEMKHRAELRMQKHRCALAISFALLSMSSMAGEIADNGNLTLAQAVNIGIKHAPSMILAAIQVDLARADEMEAGDPFDPLLKASGARERVRGYTYPPE